MSDETSGDRELLPEPSPGLIGAIERYQAVPERAAPAPRSRGRPRKLTPEYFTQLLVRHDQAVAWYRDQFDDGPPSVVALYTILAAHQFVANGERPGRADEPSFQAKLRTLRNELAQARRSVRIAHDK